MTYKIILKYINYENNCWINNLEQCMKLLTVNIYKGIKNINKKMNYSVDQVMPTPVQLACIFLSIY